jgi:hypothetical protein
MSKKFYYPLIAILLLSFVQACSTSQQDSDTVVVPPGKADNYFSSYGQEYVVEGDYYLTLRDEDIQKWISVDANLESATEEEKILVAKRLIPFKQLQVGWFLNLAIMPAYHEDETGYDSLTKNGSYEDMNIRLDADQKTVRFHLRQEIGGPLDLLSNLPTTIGEDDKHHFILTIGIVDNDTIQEVETTNEWYRKDPWINFTPKKAQDYDPDKKEDLDLAIWPEPRSVDAWIDYPALFADGEVTIAVHYGWDYHKDFHLLHSESVYEWLVDFGFQSPVDKYESYDRLSGPLTKTIEVNGKNVVAKVWLYWGKSGTATDPQTDEGGRVLEYDMKESLRDREVIIFSGHSGPFYGFALANWRATKEGSLDDTEIPELDMPKNTYQMVLADGCETYALGQAFWNNPNKSDREYLDVITTNSFANSSTADQSIKDYIGAIISNPSLSLKLGHQAVTFKELIENLNNNSFASAMYGVHGIDNNPHLHPMAKPEVFCTSCRAPSDCGQQGYICAALNPDEKACLGLCTHDDGCPDGWRCMDIATGNYLTTKACVPSNLTCQQDPQGHEIPSVMINEILYFPPYGYYADANGDGQRDQHGDEFIEIYNYGLDAVDISGWQIADSTGTRFVFPPSTILLSHDVAVVFGKGTPAENSHCDHIFAADDILGLDDSGDQISLVALDGTVADSVKYVRQEDRQRSLVRSTEGYRESEFVMHSEHPPYSVCTRQDGSEF